MLVSSGCRGTSMVVEPVTSSLTPHDRRKTGEAPACCRGLARFVVNVGSDAGGDRVEVRLRLGAERRDGCDADDGDEGEDQAVFGEALAFFASVLELDDLADSPVLDLRHDVSPTSFLVRGFAPVGLPDRRRALPPLAPRPVVLRIALANPVSGLAFAAALLGTGRFVGEATGYFDVAGET